METKKNSAALVIIWEFKSRLGFVKGKTEYPFQSRVVVHVVSSLQNHSLETLLEGSYALNLACVAYVSMGFLRKFRCFGHVKIGVRAKKERGGRGTGEKVNFGLF